MSEAKRIDGMTIVEAQEALENTRRLRDQSAAAHDFDAAEHCGHVMLILCKHIESKQILSE